jgi:hypothetical protein
VRRKIKTRAVLLGYFFIIKDRLGVILRRARMSLSKRTCRHRSVEKGKKERDGRIYNYERLVNYKFK